MNFIMIGLLLREALDSVRLYMYLVFLYFRAKHPVTALYRKAQNSVTCVIGVGDRKHAVR